MRIDSKLKVHQICEEKNMIRKYRVFNGEKVVWKQEEVPDEVFFRISDNVKRVKHSREFHHFVRRIKSLFVRF